MSSNVHWTLDDFLDEHLGKRFMSFASSPACVPTLFVKKKDVSLCSYVDHTCRDRLVADGAGPGNPRFTEEI